MGCSIYFSEGGSQGGVGGAQYGSVGTGRVYGLIV